MLDKISFVSYDAHKFGKSHADVEGESQTNFQINLSGLFLLDDIFWVF